MEYAEAPVEVWNEGIEKRLFDALLAKLGPQRFELWFRNSRLRLEETKLVICVQNHFSIDFIRANFIRDIEFSCVEVFGKSFLIDFVINKEELPTTLPITIAPSISPPAPHVALKKNAVPAVVGAAPRGSLLVSDALEAAPSAVFPRPTGPLKSMLLPRQTNKPNTTTGRRFASLKNFVEGISNRLACRAADLAVNHPGQISPIYLFGSSSVGKTHLLEGIYSAVRKQPNRLPPRYLTTEQFISSFLTSIRQKSTADFRERFKGISILLIDDVQYLAGKRETQTEFLHTIDTLRTQGVQLVFSGDRPVKELALREEILRRLEAGMVCPIEQPEREIMLQIFRNMVQQRQLPIGEDVCRLVASRLSSHARQLSGALNRLHVAWLSGGEPITLAVAEESLDDLIRNNQRSMTLQKIDKTVCSVYGLSEDSLKSRSQTKQVSTARMLAMWLARKYTQSALSEIGQYFGGRSHGTVSNTVKKVDGWIDEKNPIHGESHGLSLTDAIQKIERVLQTG